MAEKQAEQVAVAVQDRSRSNALTGTVEERLKAFGQIAANLAQLSLNGWDEVPKALAACWLADGAGMHPAIFMNNHYCIKDAKTGRLLIEPKWEFVVGILQSRVAGFRWKVIEETPTAAEVVMWDAYGNEHRTRYTIEDAKRQGLLGRPNAWQSNTREMCLKQAIKRCGRRIGAAALMDLPVNETEFADAEVVNGSGPNAEAAIDAALDKAEKAGGPTDAEFEEAHAAGAPAEEAPRGNQEPPRTRLAHLITERFGKLAKGPMVAKASELYNAMMLERTGVNPGMNFKSAAEIGPFEAEQIVEWMTAQGAAPHETSAGSQPGLGAQQGSAAPADDTPPAAEEDQGVFSVNIPEQPAASPQEAYDELMTTVARARKLFGRKYIQEGPVGSGKFWYTDLATFSKLGYEAAVKVQVGQEVVASADVLRSLNRVLAESCDEKERGGR